MAYNEITLPDWQQLVRRMFGLQGSGGNVPVLASEIQPIAIVQPFAAEFEVLLGRKLFCGSISNDWNTAESAANELENPAGSNLVVVVTKCIGTFRQLHTAAAVSGQHSFGMCDPTDPALGNNQGPTTTRDPRRGSAIGAIIGAPNMRFEQSAVLSFGQVLHRQHFVVPISVEFFRQMELPEPIVLLPGWKLRHKVLNVTVTTGGKNVTTTWAGYIRTLNREEETA